VSELVVVCRNELLRWCHAAHGERAWNVGDRGWDVHAREILVAGVRRLLLQRVKVFIFALHVFLIEVERLAVLAGFMRATMSEETKLANRFKL
jgi:hypothetical protein